MNIATTMKNSIKEAELSNRFWAKGDSEEGDGITQAPATMSDLQSN